MPSVQSVIYNVVNIYEDAKYDAQDEDSEVVAEQLYGEKRSLLIEKQRECCYD